MTMQTGPSVLDDLDTKESVSQWGDQCAERRWLHLRAFNVELNVFITPRSGCGYQKTLRGMLKYPCPLLMDMKKSAKTREMIAMSFMRMLSAGPEVSLRGSPTVSPTTAALWHSEPLRGEPRRESATQTRRA